MAGNELDKVRLRNDFYRDGMSKIFIALSAVSAIIVLLVVMSFYLQTQKPKPLVFETDNEGRAFAAIPIDQAFVKEADLIQWINNVITQSFTFDFINYKDEVIRVKKYYTDAGYDKFQGLLDEYANPTQVANTKLFINAAASGVPILYNQGVSSGRYTWILHVPITLNYSSLLKKLTTNITLEVTVVRTQVDDELAGIAIDNITVINKST